MNPIDELTKRIDDLELALNKTHKIDRLATDKDLHLEQGSRIKGAIYGGQVASDGSATDLPTGWTSTKTATGKYKVTHNFGSTTYSVVACGGSSSDSGTIGTAINANYFEVYLLAVGSSADGNFFFIVMKT